MEQPDQFLEATWAKGALRLPSAYEVIPVPGDAAQGRSASFDKKTGTLSYWSSSGSPRTTEALFLRVSELTRGPFYVGGAEVDEYGRRILWPATFSGRPPLTAKALPAPPSLGRSTASSGRSSPPVPAPTPSEEVGCCRVRPLASAGESVRLREGELLAKAPGDLDPASPVRLVQRSVEGGSRPVAVLHYRNLSGSEVQRIVPLVPVRSLWGAGVLPAEGAADGLGPGRVVAVEYTTLWTVPSGGLRGRKVEGVGEKLPLLSVGDARPLGLPADAWVAQAPEDLNPTLAPRQVMVDLRTWVVSFDYVSNEMQGKRGVTPLVRLSQAVGDYLLVFESPTPLSEDASCVLGVYRRATREERRAPRRSLALQDLADGVEVHVGLEDFVALLPLGIDFRAPIHLVSTDQDQGRARLRASTWTGERVRRWTEMGPLELLRARSAGFLIGSKETDEAGLMRLHLALRPGQKKVDFGRLLPVSNRLSVSTGERVRLRNPLTGDVCEVDASLPVFQAPRDLAPQGGATMSVSVAEQDDLVEVHYMSLQGETHTKLRWLPLFMVSTDDARPLLVGVRTEGARLVLAPYRRVALVSRDGAVTTLAPERGAPTPHAPRPAAPLVHPSEEPEDRPTDPGPAPEEASPRPLPSTPFGVRDLVAQRRYAVAPSTAVVLAPEDLDPSKPALVAGFVEDSTQVEYTDRKGQLRRAPSVTVLAWEAPSGQPFLLMYSPPKMVPSQLLGGELSVFHAVQREGPGGAPGESSALAVRGNPEEVSDEAIEQAFRAAGVEPTPELLARVALGLRGATHPSRYLKLAVHHKHISDWRHQRVVEERLRREKLLNKALRRQEGIRRELIEEAETLAKVHPTLATRLSAASAIVLQEHPYASLQAWTGWTRDNAYQQVRRGVVDLTRLGSRAMRDWLEQRGRPSRA